VGEFIQNCKRLFQVARKPDREEYLQVAKITGLGIVLIGMLGFFIMWMASLIGGGT
jgi:protein transport protein SEC61 subunit gamma-like protein